MFMEEGASANGLLLSILCIDLRTTLRYSGSHARVGGTFSTKLHWMRISRLYFMHIFGGSSRNPRKWNSLLVYWISRSGSIDLICGGGGYH